MAMALRSKDAAVPLAGSSGRRRPGKAAASAWGRRTAELGRLGGWLAALALPLAGVAADAQLPEYRWSGHLSGSLTSTGSDTLANLMTLWTEAFQREHPGVGIQVQAPGSSTAPTALAEGTANLGPMSRLMQDRELALFEARHGYQPMAIRVALDAVAIFVHKDNPIRSLTLAQIDAMFSATRWCGAPSPIRRWGALGLKGSWQERPIQLYGRNSVSGTYGYFKQTALCGGDFRNRVNEQPGSASVVQAVGSSLNGIGYSGIGYLSSGVRAVPLALGAELAPVPPSAATALSGEYPLTRFLYIYLNRKPGAPLKPVVREFFKLTLSRQGQEIVAKDGYIPIPASVASRERRRIH